MGCNCSRFDGAWVGTLLKYKIEITADGFDMAEDNFEVEVCRGKMSVRIRKEDMLQTEEGFFILVDTETLGAGKYEVVTHAFVPDVDAPDGIRPEVDKQTLIVVEK
ncbi:MAG: hypothetical protein J5382_11955 [Bacteroidales bacterium]|nr:hypothetical protein [Bacteroidales bacterium]